MDLSGNSVHVWISSPPDGWSLPCGFISKEEMDRVNSLAYDELRLVKAFSFYFRRCIISQYMNINPSDILFDTNSLGKPFVVNENPISFNLSDSKKWIVLAVSGGSVGIDIEMKDSLIKTPGIEDYILSEEEKPVWGSLDSSDAKNYLLHTWVAKEAYLKYSGEGLHGNMSEITVLPTCDTESLTSPSESRSMKWISTGENHIVCLCTGRGVNSIGINWWNPLRRYDQ